MGLSFLSWTYLWTFIFEKAASAEKYFLWINYFVFYGFCELGAFGLGKMTNSTKPASIIFSIFSPFMCQTYAYQSFQGYILKGITDLEIELVITSPYGYAGIFIGQAIVYMVLVILLENHRYNLKDKQSINQEQIQQNAITDQDLIAEEGKIRNGEYQVQVSQLYKKYPNGFLAIKNNSFGVSQGDIMGLLGPNGAGKSTTFNILTSLIPKTSGSVKMKGIEVDKGIMDIYQHVGICPQFDAIYEPLNVRDHLELFGRMKGLSDEKLEETIEYFLKVMQLKDYEFVASEKLSGGNKRKLCVANALIGGPDLQFFDEPSSGVDPIARRFLWNTLTQSLKLRNAAITLTTHSMHEAESLCTKIGILINGKF